jgi:hypothetical protein
VTIHTFPPEVPPVEPEKPVEVPPQPEVDIPVVPLVTEVPLENVTAPVPVPAPVEQVAPEPEVPLEKKPVPVEPVIEDPEKVHVLRPGHPHSVEGVSSPVVTEETEDSEDPEEVKVVKQKLQKSKADHESRKSEIRKDLDAHTKKLLEARESIEDLLKHQEAQAALKVAESEEIARKQEKAIVDDELENQKTDGNMQQKIKAKLEEVAEETEKQAKESEVKKAVIADVMKESTEAAVKG